MVAKLIFLRRVKDIPFLIIFSTAIIYLLTFISSCSDGEDGNNGVSSLPRTSRKIFVANPTANKISIFEADESGNVTPIRAIGSSTGLSRPGGIFVDTKNDEIFVTNPGLTIIPGDDSITVYGRNAEGNEKPERTIKGSKTQLSCPAGVFVDTEENELFVVNSCSDSITVFKRTADGNAAPLRILEGGNTELGFPLGIFVDTNHNEVFVTSFDFANQVGVILVFSKEAKDDDSPVRKIVISERTNEGFPFIPTSIIGNAQSDEIFVADFGLGSAAPSFGPFPLQKTFDSRINVYKRTRSEDTTPLRAIRGVNTGLVNPIGVSLDIENNEIFVVNAFNNTITVYEIHDDGDAMPSRTLSVLDTNNAGFLGKRGLTLALFVDTENHEIFVANQNNTITVYDKDAEEDEKPRRVIGSNTGLSEPRWIYVDKLENKIFASNFFSGVITSHGITDDGDIPPLETIAQQRVLAPQGIFVDTNEIFVVNSSLDVEAVTVFQKTEGTPFRNILGERTGLSNPQGIFADPGKNLIFVANPGQLFRTDDDSITVYRKEADGDEEPLRTITSGLANPQGIFVDTELGEIFVTNIGDPFNSEDDSISIFREEADGDEEPLKTITSGLANPQGIFVDTELGEIFVTNIGDPSNSEDDTITVHNRNAGGDEEPLRTIEGPDTGLDGPMGIFVVESP